MSILLIIFYIYAAIGILIGFATAYTAFVDSDRMVYRFRGRRVYSQAGRAALYIVLVIAATILWPAVILQNV